MTVSAAGETALSSEFDRIPAGTALGHGRLSGSTHAGQSTDTATAASPPVADRIQLRSVLPVVSAEQGVDEIVWGTDVGHEVSAGWCGDS